MVGCSLSDCSGDGGGASGVVASHSAPSGPNLVLSGGGCWGGSGIRSFPAGSMCEDGLMPILTPKAGVPQSLQARSRDWRTHFWGAVAEVFPDVWGIPPPHQRATACEDSRRTASARPA